MRRTSSCSEQLAEAQIELQRLRALALIEARGLERLLELRDQSKLTTKAAEIIARRRHA